MTGALAQAIPGRVPAAPFGAIGVVTVGGVHPDSERFFVGVFPYPGGYDATPDGDGLVNGTPPPMRTKLAKQSLTDGDWLTVASPGGGGHGDPLTRPLEDVERDLNLGYITAESAESDFGAVIAERWTVGGHARFSLDPQRSAQRRAQRAAPAAAVVEAD
jgi:N-methylhydantoinase B/oxoprolinase/acetone carboxylase alpha subunit